MLTLLNKTKPDKTKHKAPLDAKSGQGLMFTK